MNRYQLKRKKARLETTWLRIQNEIEDIKDSYDKTMSDDELAIVGSLVEAQSGVHLAISHINYMIGKLL